MGIVYHGTDKVVRTGTKGIQTITIVASCVLQVCARVPFQICVSCIIHFMEGYRHIPCTATTSFNEISIRSIVEGHQTSNATSLEWFGRSTHKRSTDDKDKQKAESSHANEGFVVHGIAGRKEWKWGDIVREEEEEDKDA